jgi:hypothetical protein
MPRAPRHCRRATHDKQRKQYNSCALLHLVLIIINCKDKNNPPIDKE